MIRLARYKRRNEIALFRRHRRDTLSLQDSQAAVAVHLRRPNGAPSAVVILFLIIVSERETRLRLAAIFKERDYVPTGKVKRFDDQRGFWSLTPDDSGKVLLTHHSLIQMDGCESLKEGRALQFEAQQGPGAANIEIV